MVSCVASVEFQLRVEESPLLMEVGLACSVTVGRAGAGAGAAGWGGGAFGGCLQPKAKTTTANAAIKPVRYSEREAKFMQILLSEVPVFVPPEQIGRAHV